MMNCRFLGGILYIVPVETNVGINQLVFPHLPRRLERLFLFVFDRLFALRLQTQLQTQLAGNLSQSNFFLYR